MIHPENHQVSTFPGPPWWTRGVERRCRCACASASQLLASPGPGDLRRPPETSGDVGAVPKTPLDFYNGSTLWQSLFLMGKSTRNLDKSIGKINNG